MKIEQWLDNNVYHHSDFEDLEALSEHKEEQDLHVSVCLPTLNEEETIGKEIVVLQSGLMEKHGLIDELAVIDSGSTDDTRKVADSFGADVYLASNILPEYGERKGKGENLWKAIYQLEGDIIIYLDADIKNIHAKFAYGLLGPLIYRPEIKYVKAFYERPLVSSGGYRSAGGGRVTEVLVRPAMSLFFPELTVFLQPLSGEYAVRREVLEKIPFPIGFGVETAHLIDVYQQWGLDAFAQTDLDQRIHQNRPLQELGQMAFGIMQTFLSRMKSHGLMTDLPKMENILRQFKTKGEEFEQVLHEMKVEERPPMCEVEAYRDKFDIRS